MASTHTVEQGEHVSSIAAKYGFADYQTIWEHPANAELKKKRQNPNVLFPGDRLYIPDRELKEYTRQTDQHHRFQLDTQPLLLRVRLEKGYDQPIANTKCELVVEADRYELITDINGQIEHEIYKAAIGATLIVKDIVTVKSEKVPFDTDFPIKIGHLDPVEELSGQIARLSNLGYYREPLDQIDKQEFVSAVEEFQCEHHLKVDGKCGPATQAKLKEAHGC